MDTDYEDRAGYWLFGWLDSHRINSVADLNAVLGNQGCLRELRDVAEAWLDSDPKIPQTGINLVAGTGLRLDDLLTCPNFPCRQQQVDVLFRHAWHYFDTILLPDGVGDLVTDPPTNWTKEVLLNTLASWIASVMYIRELGAERLVCYYPRFPLPPKDFLPHVTDLSPDELERLLQLIQADIVKEGKFQFERVTKSRFKVDFLDPELGVGTVFNLTVPKGNASPKKYLRSAVAKSTVKEHLDCLVEDLHTRKHLSGSLGSVVWTHDRLLSLISPPTVRDVVLKLSLPSISGIPVKELVALRVGEGDSFNAFRAALT